MSKKLHESLLFISPGDFKIVVEALLIKKCSTVDLDIAEYIDESDTILDLSYRAGNLSGLIECDTLNSCSLTSEEKQEICKYIWRIPVEELRCIAAVIPQDTFYWEILQQGVDIEGELTERDDEILSHIVSMDLMLYDDKVVFGMDVKGGNSVLSLEIPVEVISKTAVD
ncbi:MAG: hypothetical protein ACYDHX_04705 [Methanothrix sp.]